MKIFNKFATCLMAAIVMTGCNKEDQAENNDIVPVRFSAQIGEQANQVKAQSRASDAAWNDGDAVGVYMVKNATITPVAGEENKKFITPAGDGNFEPAHEDHEIYYPVNGTDMFDFIAYYPYKETGSGTGEINNYIYPVNVSDQSEQEDIDLLWANSHDLNGGTGYNKYNSTADLSFEHKLSKFVLKTRKGSRVSADSMKDMVVTIKNMNTEAEFDLLNGGDIKNKKNKKDIDLIYIGLERYQIWDLPVYEAILLPEDQEDFEIEFKLTNGEVYVWKTSESGGFTLEKGKKHTWAIKVQKIPALINTDIEDWVDGTGGTGEAW